MENNMDIEDEPNPSHPSFSFVKDNSSVHKAGIITD